jgi:Xaa-Pro aminopeptidase
MKTDIDALMHANQIDALLVTGPAKHNPYMVYLTGGGHITNADLIKKVDQTAVLFHGPMERDEAAHTGLTTRSYSLYPMTELVKAAEGDRLQAMALRYQRMLADTGVTSGRVALYGRSDLGSGYATIHALQKLVPDIEFVGFQEDNLLLRAMATKDSEPRSSAFARWVTSPPKWLVRLPIFSPGIPSKMVSWCTPMANR